MPDDWEVEYGLNPILNDASEDPDGDTMDNLNEYRSGNNPLVFDSPLLTVIPTIFGMAALSLTFVVWAQWKRMRK